MSGVFFLRHTVNGDNKVAYLQVISVINIQTPASCNGFQVELLEQMSSHGGSISLRLA